MGMTGSAGLAALHRRVGSLLDAGGQRYTTGRRELIEALAALGRPATMGELTAAAPGLATSTAYRSLTVLSEAGAVTRVSGGDEFGRFELSEQVSGEHHHHAVCVSCGTVLDTRVSARLEAALEEAARAVAEANDFTVAGHRLELVGRCGDCR